VSPTLTRKAATWFRPTGRYPDTFVASQYGDFALRVVGCAGAGKPDRSG